MHLIIVIYIEKLQIMLHYFGDFSFVLNMKVVFTERKKERTPIDTQTVPYVALRMTPATQVLETCGASAP